MFRVTAGSCAFWLEPDVELARNYGLSQRSLAMARRLIREHEDEIRAAWKSTSDVEVTNVSGTGFGCSTPKRCSSTSSSSWLKTRRSVSCSRSSAPTVSSVLARSDGRQLNR